MSAYPLIDGWVDLFYPAATDAARDAVVPTVVAALLADYPCLGAYSDLSASDAVFFNRAAGYLAAHQLTAILTSSSLAGGELIAEEKTVGEVKTVNRYSSTTAASSGGSSSWLSLASADLRRIACIAAAGLGGPGRGTVSSAPTPVLPSAGDVSDYRNPLYVGEGL